MKSISMYLSIWKFNSKGLHLMTATHYLRDPDLGYGGDEYPASLDSLVTELAREEKYSYAITCSDADTGEWKIFRVYQRPYSGKYNVTNDQKWAKNIAQILIDAATKRKYNKIVEEANNAGE